jgi:acetyl esterase/lipase
MTDSTATASIPEPHQSLGRLADLFAERRSGRIDADMKHVFDTLAALGARPLEQLSPRTARRQPGISEAIGAILGRQGQERPDDGVEAEDIDVAGAAGELPARIYRPAGLLSRFNPMVLFFHGGGFVTGGLDSHDASARALARRTGAIVVSVAYRLAPEHRFPAAHEDAWAAWRWLNAKARDLGGDPRRLALAGEDAGANLAANIALRARDERLSRPVHQLLIHPIAGNELTTASYGERLPAGIGVAAMRWRFRHICADQGELADPRINLLARDDLDGIAPATIILAELDPLRSEGEALASALEQARVPVNCWTYDGVTQGFFGFGLMVNKALFAQTDAANALARAFAPTRRW